MNLHDKTRCARCSHPQIEHNGNHLKGHRTICLHRLPQGTRCTCLTFREPPVRGGTTPS